MIMILLDRPKAEPIGAEDQLTVELIEAGFASPKGRFLGAAGYLAGRAEPVDDPSAVDILVQRCRELIADRPVPELGSHSWGYIEAAMSLALQGEAETAQNALRAVTDGGGAGTSYDQLAAFYLAQLGDASGWPVMRAALHSDDPVIRHDAGRLLLGFVPYDGERVGDELIDVRASLNELSKDRTFRDEIPRLRDELAEIPPTQD
jgi:hypothetical protein